MTAAAQVQPPSASAQLGGIEEREYKRRIWAWTMYDWANSAFVTTVMAVVLPIYYSSVAASTLPSAAVATGYWSLSISIALFIGAMLSPILGVVADVMRGKKLFLAIFLAIGVIGTGLMILISTGDWILASLLIILARIGFQGTIPFYDALLPHVARDDDQDRVSARGYALGYLGGGLLLAVNVVMIQTFPGTWGARLSFLSVAIWWALFSIPLFRHIPEPPSAPSAFDHSEGGTVLRTSLNRLRLTLKDLGRYRHLFRYLIAFLIYNDGIGTIIGVAAIYATELGFGQLETILALLLVQFVGIPFSLIFGRISNPNEKRRGQYLAFILFNMIALPAFAIWARFSLPMSVSGSAPPPYETTETAAGEGTYLLSETDEFAETTGVWQDAVIPGEALRPAGLVGFLSDPFAGRPVDVTYLTTAEEGAQLDFAFNGHEVEVVHSTGPDHGIWAVEVDGTPLLDEDGNPVMIDAYNIVPRYGVQKTYEVETPGEHTFSLINTGTANAEANGTVMSVYQLDVMPPARAGGLGLVGQILAILVGINLIGALFALAVGKPLFGKIAETINTKRGIILAVSVYAVIAVWGFFLDSTIEFWALAWMVAMVQGGSQALSRSLYASMTPSSKSGEFFGMFSIMEKFASLFGPLVFAGAGLLLRNSRWGVLSLIVFFIIGIAIMLTVNVEEGRRVAEEEDKAVWNFIEGERGPVPAGD